TPAEIRMLKTLGGGIVGMTGAPEAFLARELEICYASISFISNMAAGLQRTLSAKEAEEKGRETGQILNKILIEAIGKIPDTREGCSCGRALAQAQLNKPEVKEQTCYTAYSESQVYTAHMKNAKLNRSKEGQYPNISET